MMQRRVSRVEGIMNREIKHFREVINALYRIASRDGTITADERTLLREIENGFKEFSKTVGSALKDGILSSDEADQLIKIQAKIIKNLKNIAAADNKITDDERAILKELVDYFIHLVSKIDQAVRKEYNSSPTTVSG
ncbi:MAG: hypothetical protein ACFFD4_37185 [Candidatus Odinarchaeota archaeon]